MLANTLSGIFFDALVIVSIISQKINMVC